MQTEGRTEMLSNSLVTKELNQEAILTHRWECQIIICITITIKSANLEETSSQVTSNSTLDNKMADQQIIYDHNNLDFSNNTPTLKEIISQTHRTRVTSITILITLIRCN